MRNVSLVVATIGILGVLWPAPGTAVDDPAVSMVACEQFLPVAPPAVVDAGHGEYRYGPAPDVGAEVTMVFEDADLQDVQGRHEEGGFVFDMPGTLPRHEALAYSIHARLGSVSCATGPGPLYLVTTTLSPSEAAGLGGSELSAFYTASRFAVLWSLQATGVEHVATDDLDAWCETHFSSPNPCEWAPGESRSLSGDVGAPALHVVPDAQAVHSPPAEASASEADQCKTIRFRNTVADSSYWYRWDFHEERPGVFTPFTIAQSQADATSTTDNRINLYSEVQRAAAGGAEVLTYGSVGFAMRFPNVSDRLTLIPHLSFTMNGHGSASAANFTSFPGDGTGRSRMEITGYSYNRSVDGAPRAVGKVYDNESIASITIIGFDVDNTDYFQIRRTELLSTALGPNEDLFFFVYGKATAQAQAAGSAGASAITNVRESSDFWLQGNYLDLTIADQDWYWISDRCV